MYGKQKIRKRFRGVGIAIMLCCDCSLIAARKQPLPGLYQLSQMDRVVFQPFVLEEQLEDHWLTLTKGIWIVMGMRIW